MENDENELTLDVEEETKLNDQETQGGESVSKEEFDRVKAEAAKYRRLAEKKPSITRTQEVPKPSDILKADEFKLYRQGYTESEIDLIMHNGGAKILEDQTNPLVLGLQASKQQRTAEDAADKAFGASGLSDIERKYTEHDLRNMSKEELAKVLPHVEY